MPTTGFPLKGDTQKSGLQDLRYQKVRICSVLVLFWALNNNTDDKKDAECPCDTHIAVAFHMSSVITALTTNSGLQFQDLSGPKNF